MQSMKCVAIGKTGPVLLNRIAVTNCITEAVVGLHQDAINAIRQRKKREKILAWDILLKYFLYVYIILSHWRDFELNSLSF